MRVASYNLWNSEHDWPRRLGAIGEELVALDADVVAMQEAVTRASDRQLLTDFLLDQTHYSHALHREYAETPAEGERPEGLAILSQRPLEFVAVNGANNNWAVKVTFEAPGTSVGFTNLHLDWQHVAGHGPAIQQILRELVEQRPCDLEFLLGDFNEPADGPAARALVADSPLGDLTGWRDLGGGEVGEHAPVTIGFTGSPREHEPGTPSERFDRIYLSSRRETSSPRLVRAGVFGQQPANREGIVPSDHLGVFVDLEEPGS